jgi:hypothetical protein
MRGSTPRRERHVVQFQLGVLELERTRREQERQTARQKVEQVERRLREIEAQIRERQDVLDRDQRYGRHTNGRP